MKMHKLVNDSLGRALHPVLYERLVAFNKEYCPEFPPENVVDSWLGQLYSNDDSIHILVDINDDFTVTGHCVILVLEGFGHKTVCCTQLQDDSKSKAFLDACIEYINNLRDTVGAYCSMFTVTKNVKALEKRYGYKAVRTVMLQYGG